VERGIDDLVPGKPSIGIRGRDVADLSAPALGERDHRTGRGQRAGRLENRARRQGLELVDDKRQRSLDLEPADVGSAENVARVTRGNRNLGETENAEGKILAHVMADAAGSGGNAHQPDLPADVRRQRSGAFEPAHHRGTVPEQVHGNRGVLGDGPRPPRQLGHGRVIQIEGDAARADQAAAEAIAA